MTLSYQHHPRGDALNQPRPPRHHLPHSLLYQISSHAMLAMPSTHGGTNLPRRESCVSRENCSSSAVHCFNTFDCMFRPPTSTPTEVQHNLHRRIKETTFNVGDLIYTSDVGPRSERKKWIDYFKNATVLVSLAYVWHINLSVWYVSFLLPFSPL